MYILGINAAYHDPAAYLVKDGQVIATAEEERFTHIKHGKRPIPFSTYELPFHAIDYCLREADITLVLLLLYWTHDDIAQTKRLFQQSGLYDPEKTDWLTGKQSYLDVTILRKRHKSGC